MEPQKPRPEARSSWDELLRASIVEGLSRAAVDDEGALVAGVILVVSKKEISPCAERFELADRRSCDRTRPAEYRIEGEKRLGGRRRPAGVCRTLEVAIEYQERAGETL